jgi:hypothetical protein
LMKRFIFVFLFAFTALFFTACSSGGDDDGGGGGGPTPLKITVQPQDSEFAIGFSIDDIDIKPFSVTATGGSGTITYQWYSNTTDSTSGGKIISGATEKTYAPAAIEIDTSTYGSYYYYVEVTAGSETVTSRVAAIDIAELISTAGDLAAIDANTSAGKVYKLTSDINLDVSPYNTGTGWTPIGTLGSPFKGTFKGGNKTISGLYIKRDTSTDTYVGLFGCLGEGAKVSDVTVHLHNSGITGYSIVGGLAAYAKGTATVGGDVKIENVHVTDNNNRDGIKTAGTAGVASAGGIVGELAGNVTIRGSSNSVTVFVTTYYAANSGGIAGIATVSDNIYNSFNTGLIKAYSGNSNNTHAGGIIGYGGKAIERCYNTGAIEITSNQPSYAGGIIGYAIAQTSIYDSYNTGNISVNSRLASYAGGIAGYQVTGAIIKNTYNRGTLSAVSNYSGYSAYVGGITAAFSTATNNILANNIAANASVAVTPSGTGTAYYNRVVGYPSTLTPNSDLGNNYALTSMTATVKGEKADFVADDTVNYGTDATAAELKQKATYTGLGWAFGENDSNPWKIDTAYPVLYWQK